MLPPRFYYGIFVFIVHAFVDSVIVYIWATLEIVIDIDSDSH